MITTILVSSVSFVITAMQLLQLQIKIAALILAISDYHYDVNAKPAAALTNSDIEDLIASKIEVCELAIWR